MALKVLSRKSSVLDPRRMGWLAVDRLLASVAEAIPSTCFTRALSYRIHCAFCDIR